MIIEKVCDLAIELHRLKLRDLNLEKGMVYATSTKVGRPRILKLKNPTFNIKGISLKEQIFIQRYIDIPAIA